MKYTKRFSHDNIKFYSKSRFELVPASWLPVFIKRSSVNDEIVHMNYAMQTLFHMELVVDFFCIVDTITRGVT